MLLFLGCVALLVYLFCSFFAALKVHCQMEVAAAAAVAVAGGVQAEGKGGWGSWGKGLWKVDNPLKVARGVGGKGAGSSSNSSSSRSLSSTGSAPVGRQYARPASGRHLRHGQPWQQEPLGGHHSRGSGPGGL